MSKRLKITEGQLKRLVVNNKNIQEQQESQDVNEFTSVGMLEMALAKELVPTVVRTLKTNDPNSVLNIDMFLRALRYEIENYKPENEEINMDEEIDGPSKEEYFAKHGEEDDMVWTGSSNKTYKDLPDGDYDDETYDDFDTLHGAYPNFHSHYSGKGEVERARRMFDTYKANRGPLRMKKRRPMDEMSVEEDGMMNESVKGYKAEFERFLKSPKQ